MLCKPYLSEDSPSSNLEEVQRVSELVRRVISAERPFTPVGPAAAIPPCVIRQRGSISLRMRERERERERDYTLEEIYDVKTQD